MTARPPRREFPARAEDARWLLGAGEQPGQVARRLGVSARAVARYAAMPEPGLPDLPDDGYDTAQAANAKERRIDRARPLAAAYVRCVHARDGEGADRVLARAVRTGQLEPFCIVLAECASPARTVFVTGIRLASAGGEGQEDAA